MHKSKIEILLSRYPLEKLLEDIKYTLDNKGSYSDIKKLWKTFFFGIGVEEECPDLRTFKRYFKEKESSDKVEEYVKVLEECKEISKSSTNSQKSDPRGDRTKFWRPDTS